MKKTYIQPSIEAVKIQLSHMVMTSGEETMNNTNPITDNNDIAGLRNDFGEIDD